MGAREDICAAMLALVQTGLNRGASGNVSVRDGDHMLITPSGIPPSDILPAQVARMPLSGDGDWDGPMKPSVEWRFHCDILNARPDMNAVVHTHAQWATVLSIVRKPIPAVHYMIAAFGGADIPLADYATFGTPELSAHILQAMQGRAGCLMANHGMVVGGRDLTHALWLANELEALAHQYYHASVFGGAHILSAHDIDETLQGFSSYGAQAKGQTK